MSLTYSEEDGPMGFAFPPPPDAAPVFPAEEKRGTMVLTTRQRILRDRRHRLTTAEHARRPTHGRYGNAAETPPCQHGHMDGIRDVESLNFASRPGRNQITPITHHTALGTQIGQEWALLVIVSAQSGVRLPPQTGDESLKPPSCRAVCWLWTKEGLEGLGNYQLTAVMEEGTGPSADRNTQAEDTS
ncbi:hypothetical protein Bbelb_149920 [Branchiostoma belcheri]|nr:hypothetical protein Bbelb_149920 [Branchiostoma belcheri]